MTNWKRATLSKPAHLSYTANACLKTCVARFQTGIDKQSTSHNLVNLIFTTS